MTFVNNKPDAGPSPKLDAPTIQTNFSQYGMIFAKNHTAMNTKFEGDHEAVVFSLQTIDPEVTQNLSILFSKNVKANAGIQPQIFVKIPKFLPTNSDDRNAINSPMQLTSNTVNIAGPVFQSFLPGGYLIYFGSITNTAIPITLVPAPTKILVANAEPSSFTFPFPFTVATQILTNDTFKINSNATGVYSFTWMAIAEQ